MKRSVLSLLVAALVAGGFAGCETTSSPSSQEAARRQAQHQQDSIRRMRMHRRTGASNLPHNSFTAETPVLTAQGPERADQIYVGSRLTSPNARSRTAIDPQMWRHALIEVTRIDGSGASHFYHMEMLRRVEWLESYGLREGARLPFEFEPLQIHGDAHVLGVFPCPEIASGDGAVVTTTSVGFSQSLYDLHLADSATVRATVRHRFFSRDRGEWIAVRDLRAGERLATRSGDVTLEAISKFSTPHHAHSILCEANASFYAGRGQLLTRGE